MKTPSINPTKILGRAHLNMMIILCLLGARNTNAQMWGNTINGGVDNLGVIFTVSDDGAGLTLQKQFQMTTTIKEMTPLGSVIQAANGRFYGLASGGSAHGAIFEYNPSNSAYTALYRFTDPANGTYPNGSLLEASNGKLYGLTNAGGTNDGGVLFEYDIASSTFAKKHDFGASSSDGILPYGSLIEALNGKLYGMTSNGGSTGGGTIFEFDPSNDSYAVKHEFIFNSMDPTGSVPYGDLVQVPSSGKIYGMTSFGGANDLGTLFEYDMTVPSLTAKVDFSTANGGAPNGSLTRGNTKLYGMTYNGGANDVGTLFEFDPAGPTFTKKIDFDGASKGANPLGSLSTFTGGNLWGMTQEGGANGLGVLFSYNPTTSTYTKKIDFAGATNGSNPNHGAAFVATDGTLYGMTVGGGANNTGTLFQYDPFTGGGVYTKKIDFGGGLNGYAPVGNLIQAPSGKLYGVAQGGGTSNYGTIFELDPVTSTYTKKFDFGGKTTGSSPVAGVILASNGKLYGTANGGGTNDLGAIYEFDPASSTFTKKFDFDGTNGSYPFATVVEASNGKLYGLTTRGGANSVGVLFEFDPATSVYTRKVDFSTLNGGVPEAAMLKASNGKLYGTTSSGGTNNRGVLFEYDPATSTFAKKFDFAVNPSGNSPRGALMQFTSNLLYGTTIRGGANAAGIIYEYDLTSGILTKKYDLTSTGGTGPLGGLTKSGNGKLYGMTSGGGANSHGTLYEFVPSSSTFTKKIDFTGTNGSEPWRTQLTVLNPVSTITFNALSDKTLGDPAFALTATGAAVPAVTFSTSSDKITIAGTQVTLVKAGRTSVTANQNGDANFLNAAPVAQGFCINPSKPTITQSADGVTLTSSASVGNQWYFNGTALSSTEASIKVTQSGIYKVRSTIDDCVGAFSDEKTLVVTGDLPASISTMLYPNPTKDLVTVSFGNIPGNKLATIFHVDGKQMDSKQTTGHESTFSVAEYSSGIYLVKVVTDNTHYTIRFAKY